ncbi:uncharacterized protein LOC124166721 [Ischnura elegans]|uniref:uncharacterized protein LOC124166721 n=1 Tax=Ischnura elegans TaxID=197161 RepID=UPI001ED86F49|nr:uncharacterized protein LOC124166721 [Ischnura elegans]
MTLRTCCLLALTLLSLAVYSSAAPASSHRKSGRTTPADPSTTASSPSSWSKKTALAPLPDSDLVPFVTSRVERVPKPEETPVSRRRPSKSRVPSSASSADNSIDDEAIAPKPTKASKGSKQAGRRRWGPESYNLFTDAEALSPYSVLRKVPSKYIRKLQLPYQRNPPVSYDTTGSVTSSTISVSPVRYKIIDMGDPWVTWSQAHGYNPHEHQSVQHQQYVRPYRQDDMSAHMGPGMYGPDYGGGLYGGGGGVGGYNRQQQQQQQGDIIYGQGMQTGAYSGQHDSVIDPFQREHYGQRDAVPWSVQVGTSLKVNDDGRRSRRQFYVQSQRQMAGDPNLMG